jgi:hypothetical protein
LLKRQRRAVNALPEFDIKRQESRDDQSTSGVAVILEFRGSQRRELQ